MPTPLRTLGSTLLLALGLPLHAMAGSASPTVSPPEPATSGDWCDWLKSKPGSLFKNPENPFVQYLWMGARFQYQASYVDGEDANGRDFHDTYDDYRRVRYEAEIELLRYFGA